MAKKMKEIETPAAPETVAIESPSADAPAVLERADPTVLGVSVPLNLTISATKQIVDAWRECLIALTAAIKTRTTAKAAIASSAEATPVVTA